MLMKELYIAVQYFYITNRITMEEDYQAIYTPLFSAGTVRIFFLRHLLAKSFHQSPPLSLENNIRVVGSLWGDQQVSIQHNTLIFFVSWGVSFVLLFRAITIRACFILLNPHIGGYWWIQRSIIRGRKAFEYHSSRLCLLPSFGHYSCLLVIPILILAIFPSSIVRIFLQTDSMPDSS